MAHLQYMPGDPRLVDQLVYELKSKGIFDQFRKDCIADVDTKPAYQNLRQRVESSVSTFLSRQCWQPDLNKNQLREKLRKHILDGNYLEQGVERIVDQVVNPKVASVFIPQVEDLVYNYLGITRKKSIATTEASNDKIDDLLPTDLEAVSPGSVKSNDDKNEEKDMDITDESKMEDDQELLSKGESKEENSVALETVDLDKSEDDIEMRDITETMPECIIDKNDIPLPANDINPENIPSPLDSPPKNINVELEKIELPKEIIASRDIPLPDEIPKDARDDYYKTINSEDDESSSDSSLRRNMSPLTPIRNFNNENSCDAQQAFENNSGDSKSNEKLEPNTFRFTIDVKTPDNNSVDDVDSEKKDKEHINLSYQFNNQVSINNFNTPLYDDSSNSNNLHIDYESDANSKVNTELKIDEQSIDESKKDRKAEEKKSSHKSSHRSRESSKHGSSKDKRSNSKPTSSRDSSRHDKKSSKDDHSKSKSNHKERSSDRNERKDSEKKEASKHKSSHRSSSHKDSKSHKSSSSSSSQRHSSKHSDEKKSSSGHKEKSDKSSERSSDKSSKERSSKDSKSSSHRSDKDRRSSSSKSSKHDDKDKEKKSKKDTDDHYSLSGRGNSNRRSTDRDSNDGSSSSKGSHNPSSSKSSTSQKDSKGSSSKSDNTSPSGDSTSPSDKEHIVQENKKANTDVVQPKPIVRIDTRLERPITSPPRLPFVPDVTLKKPKFAANLEEAKKLMKMRRFLDEEQKRMNQEAALLLEFQANVRPSLSQVYSNISGPELEFACVINNDQPQILQNNPAVCDAPVKHNERISNPTNALLAVVNAQKIEDITSIESELSNLTESNDSKEGSDESLDETCIQTTGVVQETELTNENDQTDETVDVKNIAEARVPDVGDEIDEKKESIVIDDDSLPKPETDEFSIQEIDSEDDHENTKEDNKETEYFEITVIAEKLSESEETSNTAVEKFNIEFDTENNSVNEIENLTIDNNNTVDKNTNKIVETLRPGNEEECRYFTEGEQNASEQNRDRYSKFLKSYMERNTSRIHLINCDTYEESVMKEVIETLGGYEIVSYHKNGHLKLPKTTSIVKNVNVTTEVSLPFDSKDFESAANELEMDLKVTRQNVLSPVKSECSFELSSDYDAKIDEMVNNTSRQQILEIILGNAMSAESPSKMPKIDYVTECNIEDQEEVNLKRKIGEVETSVNNNRPVLTPKKMRKMSTSDQITSTTEESEDPPSNTLQNNTRSKYLGRARRVGLSRPRKSDQPNSPSSDKSVENYEQNTKESVLPPTPNGKIKTPQRNKIQRYDTSDLYKPKLHYLSRRNNVS